jgi:hypothetical protein
MILISELQVEEAQKKAAMERERRDSSQVAVSAAQPKWQNQGIRIVEDP